MELTGGSPPGTPSRKKKKRNTANSNNCGNVFSMGVKWTMIMAQFRLMVIVRIANTGSIYTTLAYLAKMEMKRFAKIAQYYCKTHNPYKILRPKYVLKNVIITHMWSGIHQTPNNITKASNKIYQKFDELVILCIFCCNFPPGIYKSRVHNKEN